MKERPILFSAPMVRALLRPANPKTQTRRIMKPQPVRLLGSGQRIYADKDFKKSWAHVSGMTESLDPYVDCPYGQPGDRLWVRESFRFDPSTCDDAHLRYQDGAVWSVGPGSGDVPDAALVSYFRLVDKVKKAGRSIGVPSIHMPRWASRITLEITGVRVERLQEISVADAAAEGLESKRWNQHVVNWRDYRRHEFGPTDQGFINPVDSYQTLWESINGPGSWDANPWVWVVDFKRVQP